MKLVLEEQVLGNRIDECRMVEKVYKNLKGRRYLIVMNDVWSTNVWDDLRKVFPDDGNGSRIIITTRLTSVCVYVDSSSRLHQMRFIDEDQSWDLLKQKVFMDGKDCPSELEDMGKEIALRCGGLPLAIVLVGGILSAGEITRASWEEIANNMSSIVDEQLERILSLSKLQTLASKFKNGDYNLHNLIQLCQLEKLKLTRHEQPSWIMQNPTFPLTLKKLTLYG